MSDIIPPVEEKPIVTCIPSKFFARNEHGLICDPSVVYVYNDDGTINWRKMIKPEFLVPNKEHFDRKGLPVPSSTDGLDDNQILILLGGIKVLAQTRGYSGVYYTVTSPTEDYVIATCKIEWIGNYETDNKSVTFSAIGDASDENTSLMGKKYLGPIAENRAFCRAVRNFLRIHIVSQEELGGPAENAPEDTVTTLLKETMAKHNITFDKVKAKLIEEKLEGAETFKGVEDIPRFKRFELLERIKRKAAEAEAAKS